MDRRNEEIMGKTGEKRFVKKLKREDETGWSLDWPPRIEDFGNKFAVEGENLQEKTGIYETDCSGCVIL